MKKTFFFKGILVLFAAVPMLAGCTNGENVKTEQRYLKVSDFACTFQKNGTDEQVITVRSTQEWEAKSGASWLHVKDITANSFTLVADKNTDVERAAVVTVTSGKDFSETINIRQLGEDGEFARYRLMSNWKNVVVSPNGKYAGGVTVDIAKDDSFVYYTVVVELETGEETVNGPFPQSLYYMEEAVGVTDDGTIYVPASNGGTAEVKLNGENRKMPIPEGSAGEMKVTNVSADGRVIVGYAPGGAGKNTYLPVKIEDGVVSILDIPESNFRDMEWWAGVLGRGISADGKLMYGTSWETMLVTDAGMVYWDEEGVHWVSEDKHELVEELTLENGLGKPYSYKAYNGFIGNGSVHTLMSPSGKWIAGCYRTETVRDDKEHTIDYELYAAFYNTETKKTYVFDEFPTCVGMGVTDDGIGFLAHTTFINPGQQSGVYDGIVVDIEKGTELGSHADWIKDQFDIIIPQDAYITYVCAGNKVITGGIRIAVAQGDGSKAVGWYIAPPLEK